VFEQYQAFALGVEVTLALPKAEEEDLKRALQGGLGMAFSTKCRPVLT